MPDYTPQNNQLVRMDGALGQYNITLPLGNNGDEITFNTKNKTPVTVNLVTSGTDVVLLRDGTLGSAIVFSMIRESFTLVFDAANGQWFFKSDESGRALSLYDAAATSIGTGSTLVPLSFASGDDELFSVVGGQLVANHSLQFNRRVRLDAAVGIQLVLGANNNDIVVRCGFDLVSGTGSLLAIDDGTSIAHSRAYTEISRLNFDALWDVQAGDTVGVFAQITDQSGGGNTFDVTSGLVAAESLEG